MKDRQFGDFQTPASLVNAVIAVLGPIGKQWTRVLEPTCGQGNFIHGIVGSNSPPREIIGLEIQKNYIEIAQGIKAPDRTLISILERDIFRTDILKDIEWHSQGKLLVIGNPPWVTNSEIGALNGNNLPTKANFKKLRGIDAITGRSNFDLAEYIWIKLISELSSAGATIALLCKTAVARNVLQFAEKSRLPVSGAELRHFNAMRCFGAAVDACLFILQAGGSHHDYEAKVFDSLEAKKPTKKIGFTEGKFISDVHEYHSVDFIEGECQLQWRQGIKHDAASVMELARKNGHWINGFNEQVEIDERYIFPLMKGSDFGSKNRDKKLSRGVIVPQKTVGAETSPLAHLAPRLWNYLILHKSAFDSRKSSIYRNKPLFSVFGVGEYSFSDFKVFVSGLHKEPQFVALGPVDKKPVFCDDTCYFLACASAYQAELIASLLNHPLCLKFLNSIMFRDSKRPVTKALLSRIDLIKLAENIPAEELQEGLESTSKITKPDRSGLNLIDELGFINQPQQPSLF